MEQKKDQSSAVRALPSDLTEREEIDLLCQVETYMNVTDKHSQTHPAAGAEEARIYSLVNSLIAKRFSDIGAAVRGEAVAECALPPAGWYCMRAAGHSGPCAAVAKPIDHEAEILEVIGQRDKYHDMADQLAAQIAAMTEVDIGEHSSANEPWRNALIAGDEFLAAKFKAFCNAPVSARAADAPSEPIYFVRIEKQYGWKEATADAYEYFTEDNRRILYERAADALDSQPTEPTGDPAAYRVRLTVDGGMRTEVFAEFKAAFDFWMSNDGILDSLYPASSQPTDGGVRNGWALVPTKYTPEMRAAWDSARSDEDDSVEFANAWQAILAASPAAVKANEGAHE